MMQFCQKIDIHTHMLDNESLISQRLTANKYMGFSRCVRCSLPFPSLTPRWTRIVSA